MLQWKFLKTQPVPGIQVKGDKRQPALSDWWLIRQIEKAVAVRWEWDTLAVIAVKSFGHPYYVGFTDAFGQTAIRTKPITTPFFAGKLGYEDCEFFAVLDLNNPRPLMLKEIDRRPKTDPGDGVTVI